MSLATTGKGMESSEAGTNGGPPPRASQPPIGGTMKKLSAVIPDEHVRSLEARARAEDRSVSAVIRRAIAELLQASPSVGGRGAQGEPVAATAAGSPIARENEAA